MVKLHGRRNVMDVIIREVPVDSSSQKKKKKEASSLQSNSQHL